MRLIGQHVKKKKVKIRIGEAALWLKIKNDLKESTSLVKAITVLGETGVSVV